MGLVGLPREQSWGNRADGKQEYISRRICHGLPTAEVWFVRYH